MILQFDWSPRRLDTAEFNEVHELEEDSEINDGHFDLPKLKAENIKRQIIYDDVAVEDGKLLFLLNPKTLISTVL